MLGNWWCKCYHFPSSLRRKVRDPCLQGLTVSSRIRSFFFFSFLFIYLFGCTGSSFLHSAFSSCGEQGLLSSCGAQASHCSSFSCCSSVQLLSRVRLFATPWIAALPVHHQLPESTQTHVHQVGDAIQPSHPLSSPSPPAPNPSQHQSLFQRVNSSHEVAKVLEFQL